MATVEQAMGTDVYAARIVRTLNDGFTTLLLGVGHRTGLFDVMAALQASTSRQIARAANLDERYVREWLGALTAARILDHDEATGTYRLPFEYAAVLTRESGANNLAAVAALVPLLAATEDLVVAAFHSGGGVAYEAYSRFHDAVAEQRRALLDDDTIESLLALMPGMRHKLMRGAQVLDAGCGRGHMLNRLARMFPNSFFRGYDIDADAIADARAEAEAWELRNVELEVGDIASLDEPKHYDLITAFDTIHDQAFPRAVLRNICAALREGGVFLMQEVEAENQPFAPMFYAISTLHCVPVAAAQEGEALGMMWGKAGARAMLAAAGFESIRFAQVEGDPWSSYCVAVRSSARH
ncbi:MAG TPA: methyltransferase domain-containing protein [Thermoanaerobaculia bacterium]|nr:methyltransferase domain-containing protein [Thermoanaerobaculia bacterium]